jgi:hypothetical protein
MNLLNGLKSEKAFDFLFWLFCIASGVYFISWYLYVNPFPDYDSADQVYFPLLNCITLFKKIPEIGLYQCLDFGPEDYPPGSIFISWIIANLGGTKLLNQYPWSPQLLLIPFLYLPFLKITKENKNLKVLLFLTAFPVTHFIIRDYNLHSWICAISFCSVVLLLQSLKENSRTLYFCSFLLMTFSISIKHLGLIFSIFTLISTALWVLLQKKAEKQYLWLIFHLSLCIFSSVLIFYWKDSLTKYIKLTFQHNNKLLSPEFLLILCIILIAMGYLLKWIKTRKKHPLPQYFHSPLIPALFLILFYFTLISGLSFQNSLLTLLLFSLVALPLFLFLVSRYDYSDLRGFCYLLILIFSLGGFFLFFSGVAYAVALLFLPSLLILWQTFQDYKDKSGVFWPVLFVFFLISNFSISWKNFQTSFPEILKRQANYIMNSYHKNPFSWERCPVSIMRQEFETHMNQRNWFVKDGNTGSSLFKYGNRIPVLFENNDILMRKNLNYEINVFKKFPSCQSLENHPALLEKIHTMSKQTQSLPASQLIQNAVFPILLTRVNPLPESEAVPPVPFPEQMKFSPFLADQFARWIQNQFFQTDKMFLEKYYDKIDMKSAWPVPMTLWIHKSIPFLTTPIIQPNLKIHKEQFANEYFEIAIRMHESAFPGFYPYFLKKALLINPEFLEAEKDYKEYLQSEKNNEH